MRRTPLAVCVVRDGVLPAGGAEAIAEAVGATPHDDARCVLIGSGTREAADSLAGIVATVEIAEVGEFSVGRWAAALAPLATQASFVVLPASADGRDLATRLAAASNLPLLAGALRVAPERVTLAHHGGLLQSVVRPAAPFVATLQPGVRGVERSGDDTVDVQVLQLGLDSSIDDAVVVEIEPPDAATMDLAESPRIVGGGAGLTVGDGTHDVAARFELLTAVGATMGASMGATRVVTDAGWVPHSRQIGTTGVVVDPDLYVAFGISGAVQHTAGLGHPDHVISINVDPHCPMMAMADLAVVADATATLDELAQLLGAGE